MARGFSGVKDDLSEIGRHLLDVARFFAPLIPANYIDSPPSSPDGENPNNQGHLAGVLSDLAEFGGGLRSGIARFSSALMRTVEVNSGRNNGGMREDLLLFVKDLSQSPQSWLDFPVSLDDHFDMSHHQRDHTTCIEQLVPSLATLRISLCPRLMSEKRFWKIYFAHLHPKLNELESKFLLTQQIMEEMSINLKKKMQNRLNTELVDAVAESSSVTSDKEIDNRQEGMHVKLKKEKQNRVNSQSQNLMAESSSSSETEMAGNTQQEANQSQLRPRSTEATTLQCIDGWFDTPVRLREVDSYTEIRQQISSKEYDSYTEAEDGENIVLLRKCGSSSSEEFVGQGCSLISSNEWLQSGDHSGLLERLPNKGLTDDETGDWHAVENSLDYEIVD